MTRCFPPTLLAATAARSANDHIELNAPSAADDRMRRHTPAATLYICEWPAPAPQLEIASRQRPTTVKRHAYAMRWRHVGFVESRRSQETTSNSCNSSSCSSSCMLPWIHIVYTLTT